jgi:hypothetical protein
LGRSRKFLFNPTNEGSIILNLRLSEAHGKTKVGEMERAHNTPKGVSQQGGMIMINVNWNQTRLVKVDL